MSARPGLGRKVPHELGSLSWVGKHLNVLIAGKAGLERLGR